MMQTRRRRDDGSLISKTSGRVTKTNLGLLSAAIILCSCTNVDSFSPPHSSQLLQGCATQRPTPVVRRNSLQTYSASLEERGWRFQIILHATKDDKEADISWSGQATKSSRFGVRRRVRSVLAKARGRTGIKNQSEEKSQSGPSVVAEAASIGGIGEVDVKFAPGTAELRNGSKQTKAHKASTKIKPTSPASTFSPPVATSTPLSNPEDNLLPPDVEPEGSEPLNEIDALKADVSAAFSMPPPPLPFSLPNLTADQKKLLKAGERIQEQTQMSREGSGYVVMDVNAPPDVVWDCLLDFEAYPSTIPTVRDVTMYTNTHLSGDIRTEEELENGTFATLKHGVPSVTRASFSLSKFRLKIAAIHKYRPHPQGDYMIFSLDPACTNIVLQKAKGVWHTQTEPDGRKGVTRVWLLCELRVSRALPSFIVDYAARRAMPRATTWLKPYVEAAASLWLKKEDNDNSQ